MPTTAYSPALQQFYLAYFGRPADPLGLASAAAALAAANAPTTLNGLLASSNATVLALIDGFGSSIESTALYGGAGNLNTTALRVGAIYQNVLGRSPDAAGLAFWSGEIDAGRLSLARVALAVIAAGASAPGDAPVVAAKTALATQYTAALDTLQEVNAYNGNAAAASARVLFGQVNAATDTTAFTASINTNIANLVLALTGQAPLPTPAPAPAPSGAPAPAPVPAPAPAASSFTTAIDTLTGSASAEAFSALFNTTVGAADSSFNLGDKLDAGGGSDSLNLSVTGNTASTLPAVTVSNTEVINVQALLTTAATITTVTASNFTGATAFNADRASSALTVNALASGQSAGVVGNNSVVNGNSIFNWAAGVTSAVLNVDGGSKGGNITQTGAALTSTTLNATGAANTIGTLALAATTTALTINAASSFTSTGITGFAAASTLTVSGAATNVSVGTLAANLATINATGLTAGGVTAILGKVSQVFTGGTGNDEVTNVAGASVQTGLVDAGAGSDRITFTANGQLTAASGAKFSNFEVLQSNGATDINLANISGITAIRAGGAATFTNLTAQQAGDITVVASGALSFGVLGAATPGQKDTVSITTRDATVAIASLTLANVETINLTAATGSALTSITSLAHANWDVLNLSGASNITITSSATAAVANTTINGAAATGVLTLNFAATTANGLSITGGSGNDVITGTAQIDVINGGAGNDTLSAGNGNNVVLGGAGTDTVTAGTGNDSLSGEGGSVTTGGALFTTLLAQTEADTLTPGTGNDVLGIGAGSSAALLDTVVGLNLGTAVVGGQVDRLVIDAPVAAANAAAVVVLTGPQQAAVTAAANLAAAANLVAATVTGVNNVATFTFGAATYLFANGASASTSYSAAEDALVLITGFTGTLDVSDIVLI